MKIEALLAYSWKGLVATGIVVVAVAGMALLHWYHYCTSPISTLTEPVQVHIPPGQSVHAILERLRDKGAIRKVKYFGVLLRLRGADSSLRAGTYIVEPGTSPTELIALLTKANGEGQVRLVVLEGWTLFHIADRVASLDLAPRKAFVKACRDKELLQELGIEARSAEGYLYPDTYFFAPGTDPKLIVKRLVRRHQNVWKELKEEVGDGHYKALVAAHGLSPRQMVTLASIVEREAVLNEERPIIARVFLNRLQKGMKLQADPTCIYGPAIYKKKPSPKLCKDRSSRYWTYVIRALPPGPISNPRRESLRAVLQPTTKVNEKDYLFFVAKRGGRRHTFSRTYKEHKKAIPR